MSILLLLIPHSSYCNDNKYSNDIAFSTTTIVLTIITTVSTTNI